MEIYQGGSSKDLFYGPSGNFVNHLGSRTTYTPRLADWLDLSGSKPFRTDDSDCSDRRLDHPPRPLLALENHGRPSYGRKAD